MLLLEERQSQKTAEKPFVSFRLPRGTARIYQRAADIDRELWHLAYGGTHKDFEYCRLLEDTMNKDYTYRYLVLLDPEENAVALQPLILLDQDLAASARSVMLRFIAFMRRWQPRFLRARMLMAGFLVGDTHVGIIRKKDQDEVASMLAIALQTYARMEGISLITIKDTLATSRTTLRPVLEHGFVRMAGFPPLTLPLNFATFEEYITKRLSKVTRKGLRRKLRTAEQASPALRMEVLEDCSGVIDEIYPLYLEVARRSPVEFEVFSREYFLEAGRRMPGRFRYFLWRLQDRIVAFSFCVVWKETIHDNDIGLDYEFAYDRNLYYVSFRDVLNWSLQQGLKYYRSGPFNYEPKLHLRLVPEPTDIYFRHASPLLNAVIRRIAPLFAPTKVEPSLRKYLERAKS